MTHIIIKIIIFWMKTKIIVKCFFFKNHYYKFWTFLTIKGI
jgi:hypothetical protein